MTERTIINKMTFYDIVTLIVPSALVCSAYPLIPQIACSMTWVNYVAQFGMVLMIGLVMKNFGAWWSSFWFRNNTDIIEQERRRIKNIGIDPTKCRFVDVVFFDPLKYICGPIMKGFYTQDPQSLEEYYAKYETAYDQAYYGKRIDALESHVAFLQTWIWAIIICIPSELCHKCCKILVCYVCIIIMLYIQRKIYSMIWESKDKHNNEPAR